MSQDEIEGFRLSPQQAHLWKLCASERPRVFRVVAGVEIEGDLAFDVLQSAFAAAVERHEILRTRLERLPGLGVPVQVIDERGAAVVDVASGAGAADLAALLEDARRRSLDPCSGAPRAVWSQSAPGRSCLLITLPALFADSLSIQNLIRELAAACAGDVLEGEPAQYADLSEWQQGLLEEASETEQGFWRADAPILELEASVHATHDAPPAAPARLRRRLDDSVSVSLERIASELSVDLADLILSAWQVLLARLTGVSSFTLGLRCDGRSHDELRDPLGLFARDLPIACALDSDASFRNLVERNAAEARALFEKQEYFTWDAERGAPRANDERTFFPAAFAFEDHSLRLERGGLRWSLRALESDAPPFQVSLTAVRDEAGLRLDFGWDPRRHGLSDAERWAEHLLTLLCDVAARPDAAIGDLEILSPAQRRWILEDLNHTEAPWPRGRRIEDLLEAQVARTPDAPVVVTDSETLSYRALWERVVRLARHLQGVGAGPGMPVGLCVERSPEMLVALYAAMAAGAPYVPLDPNYPVDRLKFMLTDSGAGVVVTQEGVAVDLPGKRVCLDRDTEAIRSHEIGPVPKSATAEDLAYLIFTSGSTGSPKAVAVRHRNLVHSTCARSLYYPRLPERFLLLSSFSFDSSIAGLFWTSTTGGAIVLPAPGAERDPAEIARQIERHRVTTLLCLPSLWGLVLDQAEPSALASLHTVIVAGEACPRSLVEKHHAVLRGAELFNEYGPTEATVWCSVHACRATRAERVPIGRPIANTRLYVLDEKRRPVAPGAPGELYVGGAGVVQGYWGRPDLTAERFVADPFSPASDERLYRTGDLVAWREDGELDFLGRVDNQVKLRGHRIELDEIAAVIGRHPGVKDACVVARGDGAGSAGEVERLVAYFVADSARPDLPALRTFVASELPDYMVPAAWVELAALPRLPNGKLDRAALPAPDSARPEMGGRYVAPRNPVQEVLAGLCADVLGIDRVGIDDDFFQLGGNSLLVARWVMRIRENLSIELPLRAVFENPTVSAVAAHLDAGPSASRVSRAAALLLELSQRSDAEISRQLAERGGDAPRE